MRVPSAAPLVVHLSVASFREEAMIFRELKGDAHVERGERAEALRHYADSAPEKCAAIQTARQAVAVWEARGRSTWMTIPRTADELRVAILGGNQKYVLVWLAGWAAMELRVFSYKHKHADTVFSGELVVAAGYASIKGNCVCIDHKSLYFGRDIAPAQIRRAQRFIERSIRPFTTEVVRQRAHRLLIRRCLQRVHDGRKLFDGEPQRFEITFDDSQRNQSFRGTTMGRRSPARW